MFGAVSFTLSAILFFYNLMKCSGNEFTPKVSHAHNSDDKMKNEGMDI